VNGFAYLQGGARSYIPGGNDPHQIYADYGYYARHHYTVGGLRDWTCGCLNSGVFAIADETAAAIRFQIDTGGTVSMYNACSVGGGLTVYNGLNVASGTLTCGLLNCNAGMNVSGSLNVWSGGLYVASGDLTVNANINVGGSVNSSYFYSSGNIIAGNTVQAGYLHSTGDIRADHDITSGNQIVSNYFYSYGGSQVNGSLTVNQNAAIGGNPDHPEPTPDWAVVLKKFPQESTLKSLLYYAQSSVSQAAGKKPTLPTFYRNRPYRSIDVMDSGLWWIEIREYDGV